MYVLVSIVGQAGAHFDLKGSGVQHELQFFVDSRLAGEGPVVCDLERCMWQVIWWTQQPHESITAIYVDIILGFLQFKQNFRLQLTSHSTLPTTMIIFESCHLITSPSSASGTISSLAAFSWCIVELPTDTVHCWMHFLRASVTSVWLT